MCPRFGPALILTLQTAWALVSLPASAQTPASPAAAEASPPAAERPAEPSMPSPTPELKPEVRKVKSSFYISGFGSVAVWRVTLENPGPRAVGNIRWETVYGSETGVALGGGKGVILRVISPRSRRTFEVKEFMPAQTARGDFFPLGAEFVQDLAPEPNPSSKGNKKGDARGPRIQPSDLPPLTGDRLRWYRSLPPERRAGFDEFRRKNLAEKKRGEAATGSKDPQVVVPWLLKNPVK